MRFYIHNVSIPTYKSSQLHNMTDKSSQLLDMTDLNFFPKI